jgi:hypothetical protein
MINDCVIFHFPPGFYCVKLEFAVSTANACALMLVSDCDPHERMNFPH